MTPGRDQTVLEGMYQDLERRTVAGPSGLCPVDIAGAFLAFCHAQTCGKCVPCRVGLAQLQEMIRDVLEGRASEDTIDLIERTARTVSETADCAIGYEAAEMVLKGVTGFREDYLEHVRHHRCMHSFSQPVPCVSLCPAGVDIPGYIALVHEGRYADAVRVIRKDNPFPVTCALICEHPCETRCRRNMVDSSINIRGLKRYAVDMAGDVPVPERAADTGKSVGIIGGGPGGLSAAYYLALMGHRVKVYEKRDQLGGMLRYGIPSYRLPRERLDREIAAILSAGVEVETGVDIGKDITIADIRAQHDAIYIAIGAHTDKKLRIPGEDADGVISAVTMLRSIGDGEMPDFKDKNVVIVGGGNVAMDCTRSAVRLGAKKVTCVYRRRQVDMTALPEEVEGAIAEGCEMMTLQAPVSVETDGAGKVTALRVQPQKIGLVDRSGRPRPEKADKPEMLVPADIIVVAIGQGIESEVYGHYGIPLKWDNIQALDNGEVIDHEGIFAGGDCVTGPATVIRAIAGGKVAAANIDTFLGYHHEISVDVDIPPAAIVNRPACGRVNMTEREAGERKNDFVLMENGMSAEEALQESSRCLRCDYFGYGSFKGGRTKKW